MVTGVCVGSLYIGHRELSGGVKGETGFFAVFASG